MKKTLFSIMMLVLVSFSIISTDAFAKRMGSGGNSGMQRDVAPASPSGHSKSSPSNTAQQPAAAGAASGAAAKPSMMGPLMGLAAGGLLAAAFMGGAFEGISTMDIVLLLLVVGGVIFFLRRRAQQANKGTVAMPIPATATPMPNQQHRQAEALNTASNIQIGSHVGNSNGSVAMMGSHYPAWFDEAKFVQQAQTWYVALQSAWDNKDWSTLTALCTPELAAELRLQRDAQPDHNQTRVEEVKAVVRDFTQDANGWLLTVQFSGYISEQEGAFAHAFSEYWHLIRIGEAEGEWKLSGIQQA